VDPFTFSSVARIVFGRGTFGQIGQLAAELGSAAMIVTNAGEPGGGGLPDQLGESLRKADVRHAVMRQRGEPTVEQIDQAVQIARREKCDLVIGLGGGSAVDAAKAVAGLLTNGGGPLEYMEVIGQGKKLSQRSAPWIAVPTTAGTGAEATRNAVIGAPERRFKASLRSEHLLAHVALVDPELGVDVPPDVTARSGMDALCQLIESFTSHGAQPMTDALALRGIESAAAALPRAHADGGDLDARQDMALAALFSGITLGNAGLGAVHGFAAPMGANFPIPHGTVCAALLPHVIRANVAALRSAADGQRYLDRYATIGRLLFPHAVPHDIDAGERIERTISAANLPDDEAADAAGEAAATLVTQLDIPPLGRFGVTADHVDELVALARRASSMRYNPVELSDTTLVDVLAAAL